MAQVLKTDVRERITGGALAAFAERGYGAASMAEIARRAGTATANVYRYFPDKATLFATVVPRELVDRHDELLAARVSALAASSPDVLATADALLAFWVEHRLAVAILLDGAGGTPYADYPERFVERLTTSAAHHAGVITLSTLHQELLELIFDGTRRAVAHVLRTQADANDIRQLLRGYWSYQIPGLDGLTVWLAGNGS